MITSRKFTKFLTKRLTLLLIPLTALLLSGTPAFALPTLVVNGGQLEGATGVDVGGTFYDVEFLDGTCIALFTGCDAVSDFTFQTLASAQIAATALLKEVFVDGPQGKFDTDPELTRGCTSVEDCLTLTPFAFGRAFSIGVIARNNSGANDMIFSS